MGKLGGGQAYDMMYSLNKVKHNLLYEAIDSSTSFP
jgi:hypothetical protein